MKSRIDIILALSLFILSFFCLFTTATASKLQADIAPLPTQYQFVEITIPVYPPSGPLAVRPPVATYKWRTYADSPDPAEVRWIFVNIAGFNGNFSETEDYIRNNPEAPEWSAWQTYDPPSIGTFWTSPPQDYGRYVFAVHGRDIEGTPCTDFTIGRNMQWVQISNRTTGAILTVTGDHIDPIETMSTTTPITQIELNGGTEVTFCCTADASFYGGAVEGFRYGWDLADPNDDDDPGWEIPFTPFADPQECSAIKIFYIGVHTFYMEVIDSDGLKSRVPIEISFLPTTPTEATSWGRIKARYK